MIIERRKFLTALPGAMLSAVVGSRWATGAESELHLLKGEDLDRLRMDFNASRNKVRMLFLLSPT